MMPLTVFFSERSCIRVRGFRQLEHRVKEALEGQLEVAGFIW